MSVQRSRSPIQPTSVGDELPESGMAGRVITGTDGPFRYLAESSRVFDPPEAVADHFSARSPTRPFPADPPTGIKAGRDPRWRSVAPPGPPPGVRLSGVLPAA